MALSDDMVRRLDAEADRLRDALLADIQAVVRIPSVVGTEAAMAAHMEQLYRDSGLGLEVMTLAPDIPAVRSHPGFVDTGMSYAERHNVLARLPGEDGAPSLILNGHMDVVATGAPEAWSHDPWSGDIAGDWLYGRGAGDMKAGLVANLYALKILANAGLAPRGHVMLQAVVDEEAGGAGGTLACLEAGYRADAMICAEPHDLNVTIAHAGVAYFRVRVAGKPAHAAQAHKGVNAIAMMMPIVNALVELDELRGREAVFELIGQGSGRSCHLNVGTLKAGDWPSSVPAEAEIECRIGFVPGERLVDIRRLVEETIAAVAAGHPWLADHPPAITWYGWQADPWHQDPSHPFVGAVKGAAEKVLGRPTRFIGRSGGIDSRFSQYYGMAAVCTGPTVENMHGIDERVLIPTVVSTAKVLAASVLSWCGVRN